MTGRIPVGSDFASGGRFGVPPRWGNGFPAAFTSAGTSSFTDFLTGYSPGLLPGGGPGLAAAGGTGGALDDLPHGTTIVAAACQHGVVMAGDRRATSGSMIAQRDIEKVFRSDEFSCVGIAGVAGIGIELVRLFQVELEHYEKLEGRALSVEGKANRLAAMVRGNLGAALQGLIVVPLFAGYDDEKGIGRIFSYTPDGGRYEEHRYQSIGSGSIFAKGALKKLYYEDMAVPDAILACVQALYDAADDDSATGGPDLARRIFPVIVTVTDEGFRRLTDAESGEYAQNVVEARMRAPDGPHAPLRGQAERAEIERG